MHNSTWLQGSALLLLPPSIAMSTPSSVKRISTRIRWELFQASIARRWQQWDNLAKRSPIDAISRYTAFQKPTFRPPTTAPTTERPRPVLAGIPTSDNLYDTVHIIDRPLMIEPKSGFAILDGGLLFGNSVSWATRFRRRGCYQYYGAIPSAAEYNAAISGQVPILEVEECVSLRHAFETNYGHCLVQMLPSLELLHEIDLPAGIPTYISPRLHSMGFFREVADRGAMRDHDWRSSHTWIRSQRTYVPRIEWPSPAILAAFLEEIGASSTATTPTRRIFVDRSVRSLENMESHRRMIRSLGFEIVRPELMSVDEQIALFSTANVVAGVTGAGLTNAMFRAAGSGRLLEIVAADEGDDFFMKLAASCEHSYDCLVGTAYKNGSRDDDFAVSPEELEAFLHKLG